MRRRSAGRRGFPKETAAKRYTAQVSPHSRLSLRVRFDLLFQRFLQDL